MNKPVRVIAYYRVSTKSQGDSGLGLESQEEYIERAALANNWEVVGSFTDVVSGKLAIEDRPEGAKALAACKKEGAVLAVAKLDRLSRSVHHIARLMEQTSFKVATMPDATPFQLHLFAALAEQERKFISDRTKDTLATLKAKADSGNAEAMQSVQNRADALAKGRTDANRAKAQESVQARVSAFTASLHDPIELCIRRGATSLQQVAECLNGKKVVTARGGEWSAMQVSRVMRTLGLTFA
ncbi:recombinase family protein [Pseudomonas poae]|uniref:Resolvase, N terminal domain n=1 Tax=Pseudomonas poae TaxID=200451 RepID=A0ABY0RD77_9PSED|nr:recombinase family protein [Pseudomonas poae]KRP46116.1 serine recombinase [Pseudomonas poae]SDN71604.1 Resolvase, N terminal domain [Pseudomonas poae]